MCLEGSGERPRRGNAYGRNAPTVVPMTTPPAAFSGDKVVAQAWPRPYSLASWPAPCAVAGGMEAVPHLLAFRGMVTMTTRGATRSSAEGPRTWAPDTGRLGPRSA
jgi:hypothetical protein